MNSGYYQIPIKEDSKYKTSFITPDGQFEFNRMPFGICTAPSVFQRMINKILGPLRGNIGVGYLDDILIPSKNFEQGVQRLETILQTFRTHNLTLNPKKCKFFHTKVNYLGYEISKEGMRPGAEKTKSVKEFPKPKNIHNVRQFLGLTGFFRQFIKDYAIITKPLTKLIKKDQKWLWGLEQQESFDTLKTMLCERPILAIYNSNLETEVHTDASQIGLAGILLQRQENNKLQPVAFYSRQTNSAEMKYHSYELETLAVVETFRDIEESLNEFSGQSSYPVTKFINDFENTAEIMQWSEKQKIIYGKRLLKGTVKLAVRYEPLLNTWKQLKQERTRSKRRDRPQDSLNMGHRRSDNRKRNVLKCFSCCESGHRSRDCHNKKRGPKCCRCSNYGHKAFNCTQSKMCRSPQQQVSLVRHQLMMKEEMCRGPD